MIEVLRARETACGAVQGFDGASFPVLLARSAKPRRRPVAVRLMFAAAVTLFATACGGGGGDSTSAGPGDGAGPAPPAAPIEVAPPPEESEAQPETEAEAGPLLGYVIDGPVSGAEVVVRDASGQELATSRTGDDARFTIEMPEGTTYPLSVQATGGINASTGSDPGFVLAGIVTSRAQRHVVLSSLSSLVMSAAACGAESRGDTAANSHRYVANDTAAALAPLRAYGFGLTAAQKIGALRGHPRTGEEAAALLLASEGMAESLRRAAVATGSSVADVLWALACNLADGGSTDNGPPQQIAAFQAAATAVALETARGRLRVAERDTDVVGLLESAVSATFGVAAGFAISDLPLTDELLEQILRNANAALAAAPSSELFELYDRMFSITGNDSRSSVNARLESLAYSDRLTDLLGAVAIDSTRADQLNGAVTEISSMPPPDVTFTASPSALGSRDTGATTLAYVAAHTTACSRSASGSVSDQWTGTHGSVGEVQAGPIQQVTTFQLRCVGPGGIVEHSIDVTIPPDVQISWADESGATTTSFNLGERVRIALSTQDPAGAAACEVRRDDTGALVSPGDSLSAEPDLSVSVTCEWPGGVLTQYVPVRAARLLWQAPTAQTDGSPLTNLAGYRIYHGTSSGSYSPEPIYIDDPTRTSHTEGFPSGPRYFVMTAVASDGSESDRTAELFKQIP